VASAENVPGIPLPLGLLARAHSSPESRPTRVHGPPAPALPMISAAMSANSTTLLANGRDRQHHPHAFPMHSAPPFGNGARPSHKDAWLADVRVAPEQASATHTYGEITDQGRPELVHGSAVPTQTGHFGAQAVMTSTVTHAAFTEARSFMLQAQSGPSSLTATAMQHACNPQACHGQNHHIRSLQCGTSEAQRSTPNQERRFGTTDFVQHYHQGSDVVYQF